MGDQIDDYLQQLEISMATRHDFEGTIFFTIRVLGFSYECHPAIKDIHDVLLGKKEWEDVAGQYPHFLVLIMSLKNTIHGIPVRNIEFKNQIITFEV